MASSLRSSLGGGSGGWAPLGAPAASRHSKGHGILHNLLADAVATAKGIPFGMVETAKHPIRSVEQIGRSYEEMYGHGFHHFWHEFHAHPLQPLLDAISIPLLLAGGAGLAIKGASIGAEIGTEGALRTGLAEASALRAAGKFGEADAAYEKALSGARSPGLARQAERFRKGTPATTRMVQTPLEGYKLPKAYSSNLFRRALTKGSDAILEGTLGRSGGYFSEEHLGARLLAKQVGVQRAATAARVFGQASVLREAEKAGLAPQEVAQKIVDNFVRTHLENATRISVEHAAKLQKNPIFRDGFEFVADDPAIHMHFHPEKTHVLREERGFRTELKPHPEGGFTIERKLRGKQGRILNEGVPMEEWQAREAADFQPNQPDVLNDRLQQLQKQFGEQPQSFVMGGKPAFAHHVDELKVAYAEKVKPPTKEFTKYSEESNKHFIRTLASTVKTTQKASKAFVHDGTVLMVRKGLGKDMARELEGSADLANRIYRAPLSVWKAMILASAPRYLVNNVVGNAGMYAAATNPVEFTRGVLAAVKSVRGIRAAAKVEGDMNVTADNLMNRYLPQEWVHENMGYMQHGALGIDQTIGVRRKGAFRRAAAGKLYPLTEKIAYRGPQRASLMGALTTDGEFRTLYRKFRESGMKDGAAFQKAANSIVRDPVKRAAMEKRVADWAGQYYHLNSLERTLTALVPFYNWDRHALRFGKEQVLSRPVRSVVLSQLGALGDKEASRELGKLPDFMKGAIPVRPRHGGVLGFLFGQQVLGRKKILLTAGYNPLAAASDDAAAIASLAGLGPKSAREALGGQLNPVLSGAIGGMTGERLFSGAQAEGLNVGGLHVGGPLGEAANETFAQLPQIKLAESEFVGEPSTKTKSGHPTLYTKDVRQQLSSLFGLNERDFSPEAAAKLYRSEKHIKKGRRKKRKAAASLASQLKSNF